MARKTSFGKPHLPLSDIRVTKRRSGSYAAADATGSKMAGSTVDAGSDSPLPMDVPTFPDFSAMDCNTLKATIDSYKALLAAPSFTTNDPAWVQAYTNAIVKAEAVFAGKNCDVVHNPKYPDVVVLPQAPTVLPPVSPADAPGASGGMAPAMGGGGGGGSKSSTPAKKKFPWIWVVVGAVGAYLLFGGKNKS